MTDRMFEDEGPPQERWPRRSEAQETERFVGQMMYLLTAPYVGWPGWGDHVERQKDKIMLYRLAYHREIFDNEMCTEFEAMLYISTVSLAQPIGHQWTEIYMWLFRRWNPEAAKDIDIEERDLDPSQVDHLARLRRWVYRTQMNHVKARNARADRKEVEEEKKRLEAQQPRLFEEPEEGG